MKIAFLFSGCVRNFPEYFENIKNKLINPFNDFDVFIHTWEFPGHTKRYKTCLDPDKEYVQNKLIC